MEKDNKPLEKKYIFLICIIAFFLLIDVIVIGVRVSSRKYSTSSFNFENSVYKTQKIMALNSNASKSYMKKGYGFYKFSDQQRQILYSLYKNDPVAVSCRVGVKNYKKANFTHIMEKEQIFYYGFLYEKDLDKNGMISSKEFKGSLCGTDLRNFIQNSSSHSYFEVACNIEKNLALNDFPVGVLVYSDCPVKIYDFFAMPSVIGFDYSGNIPFFALSSNGGSFGVNNGRFDFSGATLVFPVENTNSSIMPIYTVGFTPVTDYGTFDSQLKVKANFGGELLGFRRVKELDSLELQTSMLQSPFSYVEFTENKNMVTKCLMKSNSKDLLPHSPNKVFKALKTDPGLVLTAKKLNWRTNFYEVYEWNRFPGVLFFDIEDYDTQSKFFTRLAFYAEKTGFKGKILTNEEIGTMHGYNAHDYSAETLANFFNLAMKNPSVLNKEELLLLDILLQNEVIAKTAEGFVPVKGAVISISKESQNWLRYNFIAHESWHGVFFIDEDFRNTVAAVYYTVDDTTMSFIKGYWQSQSSLNYDQSDDYLMKNEFMAYIMQQSLYGKNGVANYFVHLANRKSVFEAIPDLCDFVRQTQGKTFEDAGKVLNDYAFDRWGLAAGRVSLIDVY